MALAPRGGYSSVRHDFNEMNAGMNDLLQRAFNGQGGTYHKKVTKVSNPNLGISETHTTVKDDQRHEDIIGMERSLGDKSVSLQRIRNTLSGEERRTQNLQGLQASEIESFDRKWTETQQRQWPSYVSPSVAGPPQRAALPAPPPPAPQGSAVQPYSATPSSPRRSAVQPYSTSPPAPQGSAVPSYPTSRHHYTPGSPRGVPPPPPPPPPAPATTDSLRTPSYSANTANTYSRPASASHSYQHHQYQYPHTGHTASRP
eukprot:Sspe_Gene.4647::Locus_1533_Transcript_5_6_Confidence_0.286_Length_1446::g.4647::m.4647